MRLPLLILLASLAGCGFRMARTDGGKAEANAAFLRVEIRPQGVVVYDYATDTAWAQQPDNAATPAKLAVKRDGEGRPIVSANTGESQGFDQALAQMQPVTWVGLALIVGSIGLLFVKPLPKRIALWTAVAGVGLVALPMMLDRWSWVIVLLLLAGLGWEAYKHKFFRTGGR